MADALAKSDSREILMNLVAPLQEFNRVVLKPLAGKGNIENAADHGKACVASVYALLSSGSTAFKDVFPSEDGLASFIGTLDKTSFALVNERKKLYDKDATEHVTKLQDMFKLIPETNFETSQERADFNTSIQEIQEGLLGSCDAASEIITAVEKDAKAFKFAEGEVPTICTHIQDSRM